MKRKLEELNLLDDFLFGSVLSYPDIGEEFCRKILKILLHVEMGRVHIVPQKVYYGSDTDKHGTRLDVFIEEDGGTGTIYDVEPDMDYDDGAATCFFYTKGKIGELSEEARQLLCYMEDSCEGNAKSGLLKDIHRMVETVRQDEEVSLKYMKVYERERMIERHGETKGEMKGEVKIVRNMSKSMEQDQISVSSGLEPEYIEEILTYIRDYPKETDKEIAVRILAARKKEE